jgi:hypothetical protein
MRDQKLESRLENYKKCNFSILERREQLTLTLRKQKIDESIAKRRYIKINPSEGVILEELIIDEKLKKYIYTNIVKLL